MSQPKRITQVQKAKSKKLTLDLLSHSERQKRCWGWGECHPAVVNRHQFDCSICPTEDPRTWTDQDFNFEVTCKEEEGTVTFQLDNLLEVKWLQWASLELAHSTSTQENVLEAISSTAGIQKRTITGLNHICLKFMEGINTKREICKSCGIETTTISKY